VTDTTDETGGFTGGFTAEETARGRALRRAQLPWLLGGRATGLVLLLVLALTPGGGWLTGWFGDGRWARIIGGGVLLVLLGQLVELPFSAGVRTVRARFGLVTQGWGGWAADRLRALAISLPLVLGALSAVYTLPWGWSAVAAAGAVVALSWLAPLALEPVFNRFTPMPPGPLRDALLALAARDGVPVRDVLVADASRRTTALNAYVSGFGATRRIVVYDTLLATGEDRETELVVAHELGHVKHRDVLRGTVLGAAGAAVGVCALALANPGWFSDPRSLFALALAATVLSAGTGPVGCALSRRVERGADIHALRLTGDPDAFVRMQRRLTVANVADPAPPRLLHVLFGTHPTPVERIAAARRHQGLDAG
jgi:STE24 endopeptidase